MRAHFVVAILLVVLFRVSAASAQTSAAAMEDSVDAVVRWIGKVALPLSSIEPGGNPADLEPLRETLKDVRVVGLGEATHGASEFYRVKLRLLQFLVAEMGFNTLVQEISYSHAQRINDFILHGEGDPATLLAEQGYVVLDIEEYAAVLEWLRSYNQDVPERSKVRFHGVDVYWNAPSQRRVLEYLRRVAPDRVQSADSIFRILTAQEEKTWTSWDGTVMLSLRPGFQELEDFLADRRGDLVGRSSPAEFERVLHDVRVMKAVLWGTRNVAMGDNAAFAIEHSVPGAKVVAWAANSHLEGDPAGAALGSYLRRRFGDAYYALALIFGQGAYQTREISPPEPAGELRQVVVAPDPAGSLAWYFSRAGMGSVLVDLNAAPPDGAVSRWLASTQSSRSPSWPYRDPAATYSGIVLEGRYDGILYIETITPTHPTPTARRAVANRQGI